jgi:hypothetical protein
MLKKKKKKDSLALVARTCSPRYSGGSGQEDHSLKPAWANSLRDPSSKKTHKNELISFFLIMILSIASNSDFRVDVRT